VFRLNKLIFKNTNPLVIYLALEKMKVGDYYYFLKLEKDENVSNNNVALNPNTI
jgi:hypothetical protein